MQISDIFIIYAILLLICFLCPPSTCYHVFFANYFPEEKMCDRRSHIFDEGSTNKLKSAKDRLKISFLIHVGLEDVHGS